MKLLIVIVASLTLSVLALAIYFMPITSHLVRYLYWQWTTPVSHNEGEVYSDGTKIHYQVYGSGKPVLLLHGGLSNKLSWYSQLPLLAEQNLQLILLDSRGHGRSDLGSNNLSYQLLADDATAVLDTLQIQKVAVLGWSDGANTAFVLASEQPDRITCIISISGNYSPEGLTPEARQENQCPLSGIGYWAYRPWTGAETSFSQLEQQLKRLWNKGIVVSEQTLASIETPVMIISGSDDVVTIEHSQKMASLLPHSQLHIIENGGHATLITHAAEVNALIVSFLKQK